MSGDLKGMSHETSKAPSIAPKLRRVREGQTGIRYEQNHSFPMDAQISHRSPDPRPDIQQNADDESTLLETTNLVISAAEAGSWDLICELLSNGNVGARDVEGSFLLHRLASSHSIHPSHVLRILQKVRMCGAHSYLLDSNGDLAVVLASRHEHWDSVLAFLTVGISLPPDENSLLSLVQIIALSQSLKRRPYLLMDILSALCRHVKKANFSKKEGRAQIILVQLAAEVNMWSRVCDLFVYYPDLNILDRDGLTILHRLVMCPDSRFDSLLPVLLKNGANVNIKSSVGNTALHFAAKCQQLARIDGRTSLGQSSHPDDFERARISKKENSYAEGRYTSKLQALTLLSEVCANVDEPDGQGDTAVVLAAKNNNWELARLLLEHGARADILDVDQRSVLHVLAVNTCLLEPDVCENLVTLALIRGALINGLDKDGHSALHLAVEINNWTAARQFIKQDASAEIPDSEGYCALHRLALTGSEHQKDVTSLFSILRHTGANLNLQCPAGSTVLHLAAGKRNWTVAKHLVELGVRVNEYSHESFHVLHILARATPGFDREMFLDFLDALIDNDADVRCLIPDGESVLQLAARHNNLSMVEHLIKRGGVSLDPSTIGFIVLQWFGQRPKPDFARDLLVNLTGKAAGMNLRSPEGDSVMQLAAKDENWAIVDLLLRSFGGNTDERDSKGVSILYRVATSTGKAFKEGWGCSYIRHFLSLSKSLHKAELDFLVRVATRSGNIDFVDVSLDWVDDVNTTDEEGFTILHRVAQCSSSSSSVAVIRRLVDKGLDVDRRSLDGDTALHLAARNCNWLAVNHLMQHGASVNCPDSEGMHVLHRLLVQPHLWCALSEYSPEDEHPTNILVSLLVKGAQINERDPHGNTPLHLAVRYKQWDMAIEMLVRGASFDEPDACGYTVLHRLAEVQLWPGEIHGTCSLPLSQVHARSLSNATDRDGDRKVCLVSNCVTCSAGSNHNFYSTPHWSPRCRCLGKQKLSHLDVVNFIHSPTLTDRLDPRGNTALLLAARQHNWNILERLLLKGANPSAWDNEGRTVLHRLATTNWTKSHGRWRPNLLNQLMEYLISRGTYVTARDPEGNMPIQLAAKHGNIEMVERLLGFLVNLNETDSEGFSLLSRMAMTSTPRCDVIARRLLQKGADVNINSPNGCSLLLLAVKARNWPVASVLWTMGANPECLLQVVTQIMPIVLEDPCPNKDLFIKETILNTLLKDNAIIVERCIDGESTMQKAFKARKWWIVKKFLLHGVYTDPEPLVGEFVFHELASCALHVRTADLLLPLLPNPMLYSCINMRNASGDTPLNVLAKASKWDAVKLFISHGADVNMADSEGWTTIHRLAMGETCSSYFSFYPLRLLNTIRKNGGDVNKPGPDGRRAANIALKERKWELFWRLLLMAEDYWLNEEEKSSVLKNIYHFPRRCRAEEKIKSIVEYLTEGSSDCGDAGGMNDLSPAESGFEACIISSHWLVTKAMLDCGDNVRLDGLIRETPILHWLVAGYKRKHHTVWVAILDGLLARGADIDSRNESGQTVLMEYSSLLSLRPVSGEQDTLFKVLVDRGANLLVVDSDGHSLLRYAMEFSGRTALKLVECFVEMGLAIRQSALAGANNLDGSEFLRRWSFSVASPAKAAIEERNSRILKVLIESGATCNSELFSLYTECQITMTQSSRRRKESEEVLMLLKQTATQPRTLECLCRLVVAGSIACGLNRKTKVKSLPLPPLLRDFVEFSDLLSHKTSHKGISELGNSSDREYSSSEESFEEEGDESTSSEVDSESEDISLP